ncbi:transmembrane protein 41A [Hyalella azteca]|uniref:Transmembrane protein 41A n=1 Tax=Hyalella azteca TaxID=294128 RepID=A0A8B7NUB6_HYAAZ|nr:transmembrane protein 41A [Hyalella azteca]
MHEITRGGQSADCQLDLHFPTSVPELQNLVSVLKLYHDEHFSYLITLFSMAYVYKQTFAIPGSALMNILGGALLGVWVALPVVCILAAVGASCCYLLSSISLSHLLIHCEKERVNKLRDRIRGNDSSLFLFLLSLRIFPGTSNWFLNMASPVADVPLHLFFFSVLLGLAPYNAVCVVAGASVSQLRSVSDLWSANSVATLVVLAVIAYTASRLMQPYRCTISAASKKKRS